MKRVDARRPETQTSTATGQLFKVADGERLIAIIGEARDALRAAGSPFLRDADPRIVGFQEKGETIADQ